MMSAKLFLKLLVSKALQVVSSEPFVVPTPLGFKLTLDPQDPKGLVMASGMYERDDVAVYRSLKMEDGIVLDVGANVGFFSMLFARRFPRCSVHAFEPNPYCAQMIRRNIAANKLDSKITFHEVAVGDRNSEVDLCFYPGAKGHPWGRVGVQPEAGMVTRRVPQISLDDLFDQGPDVRLMKIDVEGYELEVLEGARNLVARFRPTIVFEVSLSVLIEKPGAFQKELGFARENNYKLMVAENGRLQPYVWPFARVFNLWLMP